MTSRYGKVSKGAAFTLTSDYFRRALGVGLVYLKDEDMDRTHRVTMVQFRSNGSVLVVTEPVERVKDEDDQEEGQEGSPAR